MAGVLKRTVLALALPATAWAFSAVPGPSPVALRAGPARAVCGPAPLAPPRSLAGGRRDARGAALRLSATSALAVDPEAAWAQYAAGDSSMLASIAPGLAVLTPGAGEEVTVGQVVGSGKGLVVFMRHVG
jgi:hypothetical protein